MDSTQFSTPVSVAAMTVTDPFWKKIQETVRTSVIPYQWEALNDRIEGAAKSYCVHNFKAAAGMEDGPFGGCVFQDSDSAKWIEAAAFSLICHPDPQLEETVDGFIDIIAAAQQPDGYLDTYYILNGLEKRFTNLKDNHELYCLGHMIEAAAAYYQATGKTKLLDVVCRYIDCIDQIFGPEEGKLHGYPGHEVIEMALIRLYGITKDPKHLRLARYFIDERGKSPSYFAEEYERNNGVPMPLQKPNRFSDTLSYYQADAPVREQQTAHGHSVRATYLYSGMADVARETQDDTLADACRRLWNNMTHRRMYITGGIGSSHIGESFTYDYDLPSDSAYAETCASIGLVFFAHRMLQIEPKGEYADIMERALYNGTISGMSLDGTKFFYVNPLEVVPEACEQDDRLHHVKAERQKWFGCACCPPNLARLVSSLGGYISTVRNDAVFLHLYTGCSTELELNGCKTGMVIDSNYPWDGTIKIRFTPDQPTEFTAALRIPGWCRHYQVTVDGKHTEGEQRDGYLYLRRLWIAGEELVLTLDMTPALIAANPRVRETAGMLAVMRGPVVYCAEEADNGTDLHNLRLIPNGKLSAQWEPDLLNGVVTITADGERLTSQWDADDLYHPSDSEEWKAVSIRLIPYYAWNNRGKGEMRVWLRKK
ncbi:MAG: glycoside hydrolase family 127 protein [Candidatus Merdivicinus sp.]|jgi:DUF1680 family protein